MHMYRKIAGAALCSIALLGGACAQDNDPYAASIDQEVQWWAMTYSFLLQQLK